MLTRPLMPPALIAGLAFPAVAGEAPILGHEIHGAGPARVIVLHDWMGDQSTYDAMKPWLDGDAFTYAFADVRGYGLSKGLEGRFDSAEIAADVSRLGDHLGWPQYHLVGHSMTGMAGFRAILDDWTGPRRILGYTAITPVTPDGYPASADERGFLSAAMRDDGVAAAAFGALTGGKLTARWAEAKTRRNRTGAHPEAMAGYYEMWLNEDFSAAFAAAAIGIPVLVIGGRNDLPGFQEAHFASTLGQWLPQARVVYLENAGHYPMQEVPILTATLIEGNLSGAN